MRADQYLYSYGYFESRQKAKNEILAGNVSADGKTVKKPSEEIRDGADIVISENTLAFVSRGGLKLEAALHEFSVNVKGMTAVDIGASTGGFTDCLLKHGAKKVYAVDCGTDQLHEKLRIDDRVVSIEKFNARQLAPETLGQWCDIAVMDVSFISQALLYPNAAAVLKPNGILISLIKPQFEVGKDNLSKHGIVKDSGAVEKCIKDLIIKAAEYSLVNEGLAVSPIRGGDGNTEYLACFRYVRK